jgi:hypothetical protein
MAKKRRAKKSGGNKRLEKSSQKETAGRAKGNAPKLNAEYRSTSHANA